MLSKNEITQYSKHLLLPEIGKSGQEKIKSARVLVIGAGGLGCPVLQYLAAAGTGSIGIVDFDFIEMHNLPRQILYDVADIGKPKAIIAREKLIALNTIANVRAFNCRLVAGNAEEIIRDFDVVVDCSDNIETRYLINDACVLLDKVFIFGAIYKFEGQLSVFNYKNANGENGPTYRCIFPPGDSYATPENCVSAGVLNTLPGIIGTMQASEALKIITGCGDVCSGKIILLNILKNQFSEIQFNRDESKWKGIPSSRAELQFMDYSIVCNVAKTAQQ